MMNLSSILFKYPREIIKEPRNGGSKMRDWIPMDRLISDILFESKLVKRLIDAGMTNEVDLLLGSILVDTL